MCFVRAIALFCSNQRKSKQGTSLVHSYICSLNVNNSWLKNVKWRSVALVAGTGTNFFRFMCGVKYCMDQDLIMLGGECF